jgi:hypothetical protein
MSCIQIAMMGGWSYRRQRQAQDCRRSGRLGVWARADDAHQFAPDAVKHEPEASSVPAVSPACETISALSRLYLTWQSRSDKQSITIEYFQQKSTVCIYCYKRLSIHVSKAEGATAITTTRLATINAPATNETTIILPLEAGNLPRIT